MKKNNRLKKLLKYLITFIIQIIIYLGWLAYDQYTALYIYQHFFINPMERFRVPREIVLKKDCEAFKKFAESKISDYVSSHGCPWETLDPIGNFEIGSARFSIPREYFYIGKYTPNGPCTDLYLEIEYPSMKAATSNKRFDNIKLTINSTSKELFEFQENFFVTWDQRYYLTESKIENRFLEIMKDQKKFESNINYIPEIAMKSLDNKRNYKNIYYEGELLKPSYWMICRYEDQNINPKCESMFMYKNDVLIEYSFPRALLRQHREIKKSIEEKLIKFARD